VTSSSLAQAYLAKARLRREVLHLLLSRGGHSDVVRVAQELVEFCCKALLRQVGIEPPKWHDVGQILVDNAARFPEDVRERLPGVAAVSKALRKEREFAFYGDEDFIPTEQYDLAAAERALEDASSVLSVAERVIGPV
jgi:HEPN domain-containing protein